MSSDEREGEIAPLLAAGSLAQKSRARDRKLPHGNRKISDRDVSSLDMPQGTLFYTTSGVTIQKHLNLPKTIIIMVGSVAGTGIFIAPTGVLQGAGSVGASLLVWTICGLLNLLLSLCYAELGSAIPVAGGDYSYIYQVLGQFPAFMSLWVTIVLIGPPAIAFIGRTFGMYFSTLFALECSPPLIICTCIFLIAGTTLINMFSVTWASRCATWMSIAKVFGMGLIIIIGIVKICQGYTDNFHDIFKGTSPDVSSIVVAFLPGFVTYGGWDCINALAEEMKNPRRDLPIAAFVSLLSVIAIYLAINVAYFTMLSPAEFLVSDTVAMSFIQKAWPEVSWLIPVLVCLSSAGSALNSVMACPRWAFAGGRDGSLPRILSFMHIQHFTPIPAVLLIFILSVLFASITALDLQSLLKVASLQIQIKTSLALIALLRLRHKHPETPRTIETFTTYKGGSLIATMTLLVLQVPLVFIIFALLSLLFVITLAVYQEPVLNGVSFLLFLCGAPIYSLSKWLQKFKFVNNIMDGMTTFLQRLMLVVPEKRIN